jgi:hypothetical protein
MMKTKHENDILIGRDTWIRFIPIEGRSGSVKAIDDEVANLERLWSELEVQCVAGCCGLDAFDFFQDHVQIALSALGPLIGSDLRRFREAISTGSSEVLMSHRLNVRIHRIQLLELVDHILGCLPPDAAEQTDEPERARPS